MGLDPEELIEKETRTFSRFEDKKILPDEMIEELTEGRSRWWIPHKQEWDTPYAIWTDICMEDLAISVDACEKLWDENKEWIKPIMKNKIEGWATPWFTEEEYEELEEEARFAGPYTKTRPEGQAIPPAPIQELIAKKKKEIPKPVSEELKKYAGGWEKIREDLSEQYNERRKRITERYNELIDDTENLDEKVILDMEKDAILDTEERWWNKLWHQVDRLKYTKITPIYTYPDIYHALTKYWEKNDGLINTHEGDKLIEKLKDSSRWFGLEFYEPIILDIRNTVDNIKTKSKNLEELRKWRNISGDFADTLTDLNVYDGVTKEGLLESIENRKQKEEIKEILDHIERDILNASHAVHGRRTWLTQAEPGQRTTLRDQYACNINNAATHTNNIYNIRSMKLREKINRAHRLLEQRRKELRREGLSEDEIDMRLDEIIEDKLDMSYNDLRYLKKLYHNIEDIGEELSTRAQKECNCSRINRYMSSEILPKEVYGGMRIPIDDDYFSIALLANTPITGTHEDLEKKLDILNDKEKDILELQETVSKKMSNVEKKDFTIEDLHDLSDIEERIRTTLRGFITREMKDMPEGMTRAEKKEWTDFLRKQAEANYKIYWKRRLDNDMEALKKAEADIKTLRSKIKSLGTPETESPTRWELFYTRGEEDVIPPKEELGYYWPSKYNLRKREETLMETDALNTTMDDINSAIDMAYDKIDQYADEGKLDKVSDWEWFRRDIMTLKSKIENLGKDIIKVADSIDKCSSKDFIDRTNKVAEFCGNVVKDYEGQLDKADIDANNMCRQVDLGLDKALDLFSRHCKCTFKGREREKERLNEETMDEASEVGLSLKL